MAVKMSEYDKVVDKTLKRMVQDIKNLRIGLGAMAAGLIVVLILTQI